HFLEVFPSSPDAYSTLWPLSQQVLGMLFLSAVSGQHVPFDAPSYFDAYWDASASPPGNSASMLPPLASGGRRFFDDNAWTGLAAVAACRSTGDTAVLLRARQIFEFTASGWDNSGTHPDLGGVWWSQQNPNPRFAHRNTISTASNAELAAQLYTATGQTQI